MLEIPPSEPLTLGLRSRCSGFLTPGLGLETLNLVVSFFQTLKRMLKRKATAPNLTMEIHQDTTQVHSQGGSLFKPLANLLYRNTKNR